MEGKGKIENEIDRKNGLPVAGSTFSVYVEGNATAVGYTDSINTTLNVIFSDGKKSSVNSNYYNLRNSVPLLSAYHKTKGDAVSRISSCVSDHSKVL